MSALRHEQGDRGSGKVVRIPGLSRSLPVAHAIIIGALLVAMGTFVTNNLHDWRENRQRDALSRRLQSCRQWEESAKLAAFKQAESFQRGGGNAKDRRTNPEYWLSLSKVQRWYPVESSEGESTRRVERPGHC